MRTFLPRNGSFMGCWQEHTRNSEGVATQERKVRNVGGRTPLEGARESGRFLRESMLGSLRSTVSKESLARRVPAPLRPLLQGLYRRYRTAVEYHRYQRLLASNRELRSRHPDPRRCFVIANGPSVKQQDLTLLRDETTIVVNSFHFHPDYEKIRPKYHVAVDPKLVADAPNAIAWLREMQQVGADPTFIFPVEGETLFRKYGLFKGRPVHYALLSEQTCASGRVKVDLSRPVSGVRCVSVAAIVVALHLGFREIYLLGCDHDWLAHPTVDTHFYDSNPHYPDFMSDFPYQALMEYQLELWREYGNLRQFALARGSRIYNATRGGFLDVFPRVTYEKLVEARARDASFAKP